MKSFFIVLFSLSILFSCKNEEIFYFNNKGVIEGTIFLPDEYEKHDGISVTLSSLNYKKSVTTDLQGTFKFENLRTSTYQINFFKEGYGEMNVYNLKQGGIDTFKVKNPYTTSPLTLFRIPHESPNPINDYYFTGDENQTLLILVDYININRSLRLFFHSNADVNNENFSYSAFIREDNVGVLLSELKSNMPAATKVYFKAYSDGGGGYFDPRQDKWMYTAVNPKLSSEVFSIDLPQ